MTLTIVKNHTLSEWTKKMEKQKTLTEWFADLSLLDKLKLYNCRAEHEQELINDLFQTGDPPPVDVGTIPLDSTGGTK